MRSQEYKSLISKMVKNGIKESFPGLKKTSLEDAAVKIARAIHARFYGANVDGVGSPIWRDHICTAECDIGQPTIDAERLMRND